MKSFKENYECPRLSEIENLKHEVERIKGENNSYQRLIANRDSIAQLYEENQQLKKALAHI